VFQLLILVGICQYWLLDYLLHMLHLLCLALQRNRVEFLGTFSCFDAVYFLKMTAVGTEEAREAVGSV
jgi:hypothetical protein